MPEKLDDKIAKDLVDMAIGYLPLPRGNTVLCTKGQLRKSMSRLAEEAYAMGFLSAQNEQFASLAVPGTARHSAWMNIQLDDPQALAKYNVRLRPIVLRSLIDAGYHNLGDLCQVPDYELRKLFYIGRKTTRQIRTIIRQIQDRLTRGDDDA